jgi:hypothetical protein
MPTQAVAARTGRKVVIHGTNTTLAPLDDVIDLPKTREILGSPSPPMKLQWVPAEVAVALGFLEDAPQLSWRHGQSTES